MTNTDQDCDLRIAINKLSSTTANLRQVMRGLRWGLRRCRGCPLGAGCPQLAEYHRLVDRAIETAAARLSLD